MSERGPDPIRDTEEILRAIESGYPPALGTSDIAEELDVERRTADKYLRRLNDEGLVATDKIGKVRAWWLTDKANQVLYKDSSDQ